MENTKHRYVMLSGSWGTFSRTPRFCMWLFLCTAALLQYQTTAAPPPGHRKTNRKDQGGAQLELLLKPGEHASDPRTGSFLQRPHIDGENNLWSFGRAHAALHHVLGLAPSGDVAAAARALDAFSMANRLPWAFHDSRAQVLDDMFFKALAANDATENRPRPGLNVLVLGSGFGERTLRSLVPLAQKGPGDAEDERREHQIVSIEADPDLSSNGAQLIRHALGDGDNFIQHLPLIPGEETDLEDSLETLRTGYDLPSFDVTLLDIGADSWDQQGQIATLLKAGALKGGSIIHAEGPTISAEDADNLFGTFGPGGRREAHPSRFDTKVHDIGGGKSAIVARLKSHDDEL